MISRSRKDKRTNEDGICNGNRGKTRSHRDKIYDPVRRRDVDLPDPLHPLEFWGYVGFLVVSYVAGGYVLYLRSLELRADKDRNYNLEKAWGVFGDQLKDSANTEWKLWTNACGKLVCGACVHIVTSLAVAHFAPQFRHHAWLAVGLTIFYYILGWKAILLTLTVSLTVFVASLTGSVSITWCTGLAWMSAAASGSYYEYAADTGEVGAEMRTAIIHVSLGFMILRVLSFAIEKAKRINGSSDLPQTTTFSLFDYLVYTFYAPNYYTGPCFIYKYFHAEVTKVATPWTRTEVAHIAQKTLRCLIWIPILHMLLCNVYIHSLAQNSDLLMTMNEWGIPALMVYSVTFYHAMYVVLYGLAGCAMMTDRIVPPSNPRCCITIVYFSNAWRFFDPGLHAFFRNYVYIPLGGSRQGRMRQLLATMTTFGFVSFWHGAERYLLVYAGINFVGVVVELVTTRLAKLPAFVQFETMCFGGFWARRLHALANTPLYITSNLSMMFFFHNSTDSGRAFVSRIVNGTWSLWAFVAAVAYTMAMSSQELERREAETERKHKVT